MSNKNSKKPYPSLAHERSAQFVIDPVYSAAEVAPRPPSTVDGCWLYGDAELECYRLAILRRRARAAKLKLYYPGTFHTPSHHALFRLRECPSLAAQFSFRANGQVTVMLDGNVIYQAGASTDNHVAVLKEEWIDVSQERAIVVDISTLAGIADCEPAEPPCLWLPRDSPMSAPTSSWEWSSNGVTWNRTRPFTSLQGVAYPHLVEAPEIRLAHKQQIDNNLYDFGCELLGRVIVSCNSNDAPVIAVGETIAEAMNDDPEHFEQSTEMVATGKTGTTWQSAHSLAFRYIRVAECVDFKEISCAAQFHPVQYHGAFAASDEVLTKIWMNSAYTLRLCLHDFLVDGIKRDRLPWAGDLAVSLLANAYTFADADIVRRSLTVLGRAGIVESDINGIVDYSLWFVICQDLFQLHFGDKDHLESEWSRIKETLSCLTERCDDEGLLQVNRETNWIFIDWVDCEKTTALQILWWWALDCGCRLAQRMDDNHSAFQLQKQQVELKTKLMALCWDETAGLYQTAPGNRNEYSRHANILAVVSGIYPGDASQMKKQLLHTDLPAVGTPYMKTFECLALARLGAKQEGMSTMRSYWGRMIENGATTFWEAFHEDESAEAMPAFYDRPYGRSFCHAWSAGPCHVLPETIIGIRPLADGWSEWTCTPQLSDLQWASATVPTPRGCIEVEATSNSLRVVIPANTTLIFGGSCFVGPDIITWPRDEAPDTAAVDIDTIKKWSAPYRGWHYHPDHVIPPKPEIEGFADVYMTDVPTVYQLPGDTKWYMSFIGFNGRGYQSFVAESNDLLNWTNMRLAMGFGREESFDFGGCVLGAFLFGDYRIKAPRTLKKKDEMYWSLYGAYAKQGKYEIDPGYEGIASSEDGLAWKRAKEQYILSVHDKDVLDWERDSIYQPWLVEYEGEYYNFYNAKRMPEWVEQIGLATSKNIFDWKRHPENPVLRVRSDGFDADFVADGKVFKDGDHWTMFYFGVGKGGAHVMVAFSRDLLHWVADPEPLYKAGGNPSGLDSQHAHKISLVWNPENKSWYMHYCAVGKKGRGIGLITSRPL